MPASSLQQLNPKDFDERKAQHLLQRAGFGGTPQQIQALAKLGLEKSVEYIVNYRSLPDSSPTTLDDYDKNIIRPPTRTEQAAIRKARKIGNEEIVDKFRTERQRRQRADRKQITEMEQWWLRRLIATPRPLEEKLTLFWHGHFATGYRTIENSYHMYLQNMFFRENAMGNFKEDLVRGIIHDPAMIRYLNNHQNRKQAPNENLARELMELFTLGEGEGYLFHQPVERADRRQGVWPWEVLDRTQCLVAWDNCVVRYLEPDIVHSFRAKLEFVLVVQDPVLARLCQELARVVVQLLHGCFPQAGVVDTSDVFPEVDRDEVVPGVVPVSC